MHLNARRALSAALLVKIVGASPVLHVRQAVATAVPIGPVATAVSSGLSSVLSGSAPVMSSTMSSAMSSATLVVASAPVTASGASVGASVSDVYPPPNTLPDSTQFPPESVVGFQQPTPTGVLPFAVETAAAYPTHEDIYPLIVANQTESTPPQRQWGNLAPSYSVPSSAYGLESASGLVPDQCELTQVILYFRHGARYPTTGAPPSAFAEKVQQAAANSTGFSASGDLEFLNSWTYKLGAELLTPFGRKQNFDLGVAARQLYGQLLLNFTESGTLPVFRTQSQDRMVKTMQNFAAGFFGVPEFLTEYNLEITVEAEGYNNTGAPYDLCPNADNARGSVGTVAATAFAAPYYNQTAERLNRNLQGLTLNATDINAMLQLCAYETVALGYSRFCDLFTSEEFAVFEQAFDIQFHGNQGFGSPVGAAQGLGYLQELVSRLNHTFIPTYNSTTNSTLDGNNVTFPLYQSIYADAAHEVAIMDAMTALNLTALVGDAPPPTDRLSTNHTFVASRTVPFATSLQMQIMDCTSSGSDTPQKQARFIVNDAVLPLTYEGCDSTEPNGLCVLDTVLAALIKRGSEIDFDYDCNGNYTVPSYGEITDGRALRA